MKLSTTLAATTAAIALAALTTAGVASATITSASTPFAVGKHAVKTCAAPTKGMAACLAQVLVSDATNRPAATGSPSGSTRSTSVVPTS
ncbi:MAG: hypothetical protein ACR2N4_19605 [Jatrophihabitans sp.]